MKTSGAVDLPFLFPIIILILWYKKKEMNPGNMVGRLF
jgi:hypothetical protein